MNLDFSKWKPFLISSIFEILNGKGITKEEISENPGNLIAVQSGEENNGVLGYIDKEFCKEQDYVFCDVPCLTVARSGSAGFVSFQNNGCAVGDSAKILLLKKDNPKIEHYLFLHSILTANRYKYSYGRKVTKDKYLSDIIDLPILCDENNLSIIDPSHIWSDDGYIPDWQFMENYIKTLHYKPLTTSNQKQNVSNLNTNEWKEFNITELFSVEVGNYYYPEQYEKGNTPYISASDTNNGIASYINLPPDFKGEKITIGKIGATAYFQRQDFCATSDVNVLIPKTSLNKYHLLFITSIINFSENYKWSYGRQCRKGDTEGICIKLPIICDSKRNPIIDESKQFSNLGYTPDWQFMENYIKSLPFGDKI